MSALPNVNLVEVNICVTRARKLLSDRDHNAIPELVGYYDRYIQDAISLERMFQESGLGRYEVLAQFKRKVAAEIITCIEALNAIRISDSFENDSFQEAVRKFK